MTTLELRKQIEDKVNPVLEWTPLELSILYKALRASGYSTDGLDFRIDKWLLAQVHRINQS